MGKEQELIFAAQTGNLGQIDKILGQRAKKSGPLQSIRKSVGPNCQDQNGYTPLHHAALNGRRDAVEALLKFEASTNIPDFAGNYPLHLAAWNGHADVLELLLNRGPSRANVNEQNNNNETALHLACQYGHNRVVVVLLECHADPNYRNLKHESALDLAAQYGRLESVNSLLMYYPALVKKTIIRHTPIHLAARNGHYAVVKSLIDKGMSPNTQAEDGTPLHVAALYGKSDIVKLLLQSGVDINIRDGKSQTVMDLLAANPSQRSREITAWIYTYIQNAKQSSVIGGKNRTVSERAPANQLGYDAIPPPRPLSEFASSSNIVRPAAYDEVPPPVSSKAARSKGSFAEIPNENYDVVPTRPARSESVRSNLSQINKQMSYDEVPFPRPINETKHAISMPSSMEVASSPASYDFVPPPRQASDPSLLSESAHGVVNRPKSLELNSSQYKVPVTNNGAPVGRNSPIRVLYGVASSNHPDHSHSSMSTVQSGYGFISYPGDQARTGQPVSSVYGLVQYPYDKSGSSTNEGPRCPLNTSNYTKKSNGSVGETALNKGVLPERPMAQPVGNRRLQRTASSPAPESSYELVELPVAGSGTLCRKDRSSPIAIRSQDHAYSREGVTYDTVTSPPLRRADPIGAPESPYKNLEPIIAFQQAQARSTTSPGFTLEGRTEDDLRHSEMRREPDGAKDQDQLRVLSPSRSGLLEYDNVPCPKRLASNNLQKGLPIYQNTPVLPPSYEYNVPTPRAHGLFGSFTCSRSSPSSETRPRDSALSGSHRSSPSSDRRNTDYENIELSNRNLSEGSPSSLRNRTAYEELPPKVRQSPVESESSKVDAQAPSRPPMPKPYHESRKAVVNVPNNQNDRDNDYCTLKEALSGVVSPDSNESEEFSPYPPFSPPSPTTAGQYLFNAFESKGQEQESGGNDESGRRGSDCSDTNNTNRTRTLKYENVMFDKPSPSSSTGESGDDSHQGMLSESYRLSSVNDGLLNEYEEWKKIERFMNSLGKEIGEECKEAEEHMTSGVGKWLNSFGLGLYESYLLANGFDDTEFIAGGVLDEQDLLQVGVLDPVYRKTILGHVNELAIPPRVGVNGFEPKTVEEWLKALHLDEYLELFRQKGYGTMDRIKQMWELELESVLAIHTLGHRKRILASLPEVKRRDTEVVSTTYIREKLAEIDIFGGERRDSLDVVNPGIFNWKTAAEISKKYSSQEHQQEELRRQQQQASHETQQPQIQQLKQLQQENQQQQKQQQQQQRSLPPKAPKRDMSAKERESVSKSNVQRKFQGHPHWNHPSEALLKGHVNYTTKYLGSHFIKDVIGECSTIEACRKMRMSTQKLQKIPVVILSISVTGVRFIDGRTRIAISSHHIHNISYCTQDVEDRSVFAYIAKDQKANAHYCHVFKANSVAVSDEIVMTIGQAFELAFEQYTRSQYTTGEQLGT